MRNLIFALAWAGALWMPLAAAAAPAAPPPGPPSPAAKAGAPSADRLALAHRYLEVMRLDLRALQPKIDAAIVHRQ